MIHVTEKARSELKRILCTTVDMPQARLRLLARGQGGIGIGLDIEMPDDEVVEHDGSTVLLVNKELAARLTDMTIDVDDTPEGPELIVSGQLRELGKH